MNLKYIFLETISYMEEEDYNRKYLQNY